MVLLLTLLGLTTPSLGAPTISASLSPKSFAVDQGATLTITILEGKGSIDQLPEVDGLLFQRRGQSRQHQIINGSLSSSVSTIFQVQATRPGTFTIPPITVTVEGQPLKTEAIRVAVTPATGLQAPDESLAPPSASDGSEQMAFLRISPVKQESYPGELLPLQIKAYFRSGLRASLNSHPRINGDGFLLTLPAEEPRQTEELVDGIAYAVLTWTGSLSGIKEGEQSLRVAVESTLLLPTGNSRRNRLKGGDPFFGNDPMADFFNQQQMQEKKIQLISPETTLTVLPLPTEGRPEDFSGAIGRFQLEVKAQPTDVGPGDPITLTMTVQGSGNFDRVEAPPFSTNGGWKSYTPTAKFTPGAAPGQGTKIFEQAIIAKDSLTKAIPSLAFSFFDPENKQYQTLHSAPIPLHINGAAEPGKNASPTSDAGKMLNAGSGGTENMNEQGLPPSKDGKSDQPGRPAANGLDLAPLHPQLGTLHPNMIPLMNRLGFQAGVLAAMLLLITAITLKIRARHRTGDPARSRRQEMTRLLDHRIREIHTARDQGDTRAFLALCRQAMQEQLGALWQMEPGAITLADLRQRLAADATLLSLFGTAETSAYGGCQLSSQEMTEYAQKLEAELRRLA
ncbi:MAG: protein BatD [Chlorobium sp.]|nr:protein BatD [Chlorobium sp.]